LELQKPAKNQGVEYHFKKQNLQLANSQKIKLQQKKNVGELELTNLSQGTIVVALPEVHIFHLLHLDLQTFQEMQQRSGVAVEPMSIER